METKKIRILLADDHNIMRRGLRLLLERQPGFEVVGEGADGRQAVEAAEAAKPNVVVLDIAMPNMSGIDAAQRISALLPHAGDCDLEHALGRGVRPAGAQGGSQGVCFEGLRGK